ncbi:SCO0930 family lipoprotein [Streptomyces olivaceoviridis]
MRTRLAHVAVGAAVMCTVAGCGQTLSIGSRPASSAPASNAGIQLVDGPAPATTAAGPTSIPLGSLSAPKAVQLSAKTSALGTIVTDTRGRTLYRFDEDSPKPPTTTCTGGCQTTWPPVIVRSGGKVYADGVPASAVGTVTRPDGTLQLTIGGWPLYRFSGDHAKGDTNGQGVNGTWFAIAPDGKKVSTAGAGTQAPSSGSRTILTAQRSAQGLVVASGDGRTIYVNSTDRSEPSTVQCTGTCSDGFTPVPAGTGGITIKGLASSDIGSVRRPDGTTQMTLVGFPLYTSTKDTKPGDTAGGGMPGWFTISLDGRHQG